MREAEDVMRKAVKELRKGLRWRDFYGDPFKVGDQVLTPSGRVGVAVDEHDGRVMVTYLDNGEEVQLDPRLLRRYRDGEEQGRLVVPTKPRTLLRRI
ncbi:MAG: hypothetical protein AB1830_13050 [Pseudomonadota bacterium]